MVSGGQKEKRHGAQGSPVLAQMIRDHRKRHGLSTQEFAAQLGLSRSFLAHVEAGSRPITSEKTVKTVAKTIGAHPYDIYAAVGYTPHDLDRIIKRLSAPEMMEVKTYIGSHMGIYDENP